MRKYTKLFFSLWGILKVVSIFILLFVRVSASSTKQSITDLDIPLNLLPLELPEYNHIIPINMLYGLHKQALSALRERMLTARLSIAIRGKMKKTSAIDVLQEWQELLNDIAKNRDYPSTEKNLYLTNLYNEAINFAYDLLSFNRDQAIYAHIKSLKQAKISALETNKESISQFNNWSKLLLVPLSGICGIFGAKWLLNKFSKKTPPAKPNVPNAQFKKTNKQRRTNKHILHATKPGKAGVYNHIESFTSTEIVYNKLTEKNKSEITSKIAKTLKPATKGQVKNFALLRANIGRLLEVERNPVAIDYSTRYDEIICLIPEHMNREEISATIDELQAIQTNLQP